MRARMIIVLASAALAGSLLATDAQARGDGGHGGHGRDYGFRDNHFSGGSGDTPVDAYGGYGNRGSGSGGQFREYVGPDVWGHRGAYYGPMIPTI
jgi:hypothetical protein